MTDHTNQELCDALADQRRNLGAQHDKTIAELKRVREFARAEIEKLTIALKWALGEAPDAEGAWFGDNRGNEREKARTAPYWWRTHLRKIAGFPAHSYDKELRPTDGQQSPK